MNDIKRFFVAALLALAFALGLGTLFFSPPASESAAPFVDRMKGRIVLQVENNGEAWYVRPDTGARVYLGRPADAFAVMRSLGLGITNANLNKIPMGIVTPEMTAQSTIDAALYAGLKKALPCTTHLDRGDTKEYIVCHQRVLSGIVGVDLAHDSDNDGYDDISEILSNYNPYGPGKMPIDSAFAKKFRGTILLQVEKKGEAWYVEPMSGRRYFLGRPADAFAMMRGFGLGILNRDLALLSIDTTYTKTTPTPTRRQVFARVNDAHTAFGLQAMRALTAEDKGNVFISPSGIALALSLVYNGAQGETKSAMQKTLQFQNLDIAAVNQESLTLINSLKNPDPNVELSLANSVWARKGVEFKKDFLSVVEKYFNADIATLDFSNARAADTINAWVSKNTKAKIPTIVSPPIPDDRVMYLINAVYFKGSWTTEFDKKLTEDRNFTPADGVSKKHPLMRQHGDLPYLETEDFQSVNLTYGKNKRLSMIVFLPKNLNHFVQTLDANKWNDWMKQYKETEGTLLLPRFKMEYEKGLIPLLTQLGMGAAFQDNADLTGIGNNLKMSEVKHKTYVDVNEEGTEAAAVTSVEIGITSVQPAKKTFFMEVNRPFFFAIRDDQTQEVLFMGVVRNPL